jgi:hypothetical protein
VSQCEDGCEIILIHTMNAYGGIDIAPLILNEIMVSRQPHASAAIIPRKKSLVPIEWKVGCAPESVWTLWRIENWLG